MRLDLEEQRQILIKGAQKLKLRLLRGPSASAGYKTVSRI